MEQKNKKIIKIVVGIFIVALISIIILLCTYYILPQEKFNNILYKANKNVEVQGVETIQLPKFCKSSKYRWVGGILGEDDYIYAIPTGAEGVLKINTKTGDYKVFGDIQYKEFNYTGGGYYEKDGCIYGFPRTSDNLLKIDLKKEHIEEIKLNVNYSGTNNERYYGGVIYKDTIYLCPRSAHHILAINLKDYSTRKIGEGKIPNDYWYSGAILHYNGKIYFYPNSEKTRTMVLDTKTENIEFIGEPINCYCYGAVIANNECIYGFSSYSEGILKIDPINNKVSKILSKEVESGHYGSKIGVNGKIYSIPGSSNKIYEFDPETEKLNLVYEIEENQIPDAKCAGGAIDRNGNIWFMPAMGDKIYKLNFTNHMFNFRKDIIKSTYLNNY